MQSMSGERKAFQEDPVPSSSSLENFLYRGRDKEEEEKEEGRRWLYHYPLNNKNNSKKGLFSEGRERRSSPRIDC